MSACVRTQIEEECKRCCYCLRLLTVRDVPIHFFSRINAHIGPDIIWRWIGPIPTAISPLAVIFCFPSILSLRKVHWLTWSVCSRWSLLRFCWIYCGTNSSVPIRVQRSLLLFAAAGDERRGDQNNLFTMRQATPARLDLQWCMYITNSPT